MNLNFKSSREINPNENAELRRASVAVAERFIEVFGKQQDLLSEDSSKRLIEIASSSTFLTKEDYNKLYSYIKAKEEDDPFLLRALLIEIKEGVPEDELRDIGAS